MWPNIISLENIFTCGTKQTYSLKWTIYRYSVSQDWFGSLYRINSARHLQEQAIVLVLLVLIIQFIVVHLFWRGCIMVSQRTVLVSLLYFSILVFFSIWSMTRNFPEKQCDCKKCLQQHWPVSQMKSKRNTQDGRIDENINIGRVLSDY